MKINEWADTFEEAFAQMEEDSPEEVEDNLDKKAEKALAAMNMFTGHLSTQQVDAMRSMRSEK